LFGNFRGESFPRNFTNLANDECSPAKAKATMEILPPVVAHHYFGLHDLASLKSNPGEIDVMALLEVWCSNAMNWMQNDLDMKISAPPMSTVGEYPRVSPGQSVPFRKY
jgi:hypothetical protein